jgi:hypothetical protein
MEKCKGVSTPKTLPLCEKTFIKTYIYTLIKENRLLFFYIVIIMIPVAYQGDYPVAYASPEPQKVHIVRQSHDGNQPTVFVAKEKYCGPFSTFAFIILLLTFFPAAFCGKLGIFIDLKKQYKY